MLIVTIFGVFKLLLHEKSIMSFSSVFVANLLQNEFTSG